MNQSEQKEPEYMIYCSRCGSEMKNTSRYCMKCGNLNASHPLNQPFTKVIEKTNKKGFNIKGKMFSVINTNEVNAHNMDSTVVSSDPSGFNTCFFLNFLTYALLSFSILFFFFFTNDMDFTGLISSNVGIILLYITVIFFFMYAWELIFIKMDKPWWKALIPIYNFYIVADVVYNGKKNYKTITLIPIVGQLFYIVLIYKLGEAFKVTGSKMVILFPIMLPKVAFGGSSFNNIRYVGSENSGEKEFKKKKIFITTCSLLAVFSSVSVFFTRLGGLSSDIGDTDAKYLVDVANIAVKGTVEKVKSKSYTCNFESSTFYFHYPDVSDFFNVPLAVFHEPVSAYVKVENTGIVDEYKYYISISDGEKGFEEVPMQDISTKIVKEYYELDDVYDNGNLCVIH